MTALGWDEWDIVLVTGDAYTAGDEGGRRPDRCTILNIQRCREAWKDLPVVLGGIEASHRALMQNSWRGFFASLDFLAISMT